MANRTGKGTFKKGQQNPGSRTRRAKTKSGRAKGARNKITRDIKEALLQSFEALGGQYWLESLARRRPAAYATLVGKLLPMQLTGKDGAPINVTFSKEDETL